MKDLKFGYIFQIAIVVAIILVAGGYQLPKYAGRITALAFLAVVDMIYWLSVKKAITRSYRRRLTFIYWLPLFMLLLFFIGGIFTPYSNWTPILRIYFAGILLVLLIGKGIFLTLLVISDIFIIPLNMIRRVDPENTESVGGWYRPRSFLLTSGAISSLVMLVYFSGMFFWVGNYKLNIIEIPVKNLPAAFDGYRVIQISDLHLGNFLNSKPLEKIIKVVNDQNADVILFTGDLVSFVTNEAYPFEESMKRFSATDGIYAILGNHDYGDYSQWPSQEDKDLNNQALADFYKRIGWQLLRNENIIIERDSSSLAIMGVENWSANKHFGKKGDIHKALIGAKSSDYKILMTHDPSHWDGEVNSKFMQIGLTLSGHTHAFQFAIETNSLKWSPASLFFSEWGGLYEKVNENGEKQYLYVNRGAGTLGYPGRIGTRPEITLLILKKAD
jgi:predicted MPP superfamily phosphohydrolase